MNLKQLTVFTWLDGSGASSRTLARHGGLSRWEWEEVCEPDTWGHKILPLLLLLTPARPNLYFSPTYSQQRQNATRWLTHYTLTRRIRRGALGRARGSPLLCRRHGRGLSPTLYFLGQSRHTNKQTQTVCCVWMFSQAGWFAPLQTTE